MALGKGLFYICYGLTSDFGITDESGMKDPTSLKGKDGAVSDTALRNSKGRSWHCDCCGIMVEEQKDTDEDVERDDLILGP